MVMRAAFYKAVRPGIPGLYNRLVQWWEQGPYSHSELVFSDGMAASSSWMDGGVRFKEIDFSSDKWDFIDLPEYDEDFARQWFIDHKDAKYNLRGQLHFAIGPLKGADNYYFCSQADLAALKFKEPWRYGPNAMFDILSSIYSTAMVRDFLRYKK